MLYPIIKNYLCRKVEQIIPNNFIGVYGFTFEADIEGAEFRYELLESDDIDAAGQVHAFADGERAKFGIAGNCVGATAAGGFGDCQNV